jgi:NTE family protein
MGDPVDAKGSGHTDLGRRPGTGTTDGRGDSRGAGKPETAVGDILRNGSGRPGRRPVALVLSGGGLSGGMFEVGCLAALDEFLSPERRVNDFDLFIGVSAGALVAALVANGIRPVDARDAIRRDLPSPLNIKLGTVAGAPWRAAWGVALETVRKAVGQVAPLARAHGNGWAAMVPRLLGESLPAGFFSMDRLEGHLAQLLSTPPYSNDFRELRGRLFIPAMALDTGERWNLR